MKLLLRGVLADDIEIDESETAPRPVAPSERFGKHRLREND